MKTILVVLFSFGIAIAVPAQAATLVNNFPLVTQAEVLDAGRRGAQPFHTGLDTYILTEVAIIGYKLSSSQDIALKIYNTTGGFSPNNSVATIFSGTAGAAGFNDNFSFLTPSVFSSLSVELLPDTTYWLVLENRSTDDIWFGYTAVQGSAPAQGTGYIASSKVAQGLTGSFDLNNTREYSARIQAVPEPTSAALLVFGVAFCLRRRALRTHERIA